MNPPYDDIGPWAAKAALSSPVAQDKRKVFMLVPASVGSAWFLDHVLGKALVLALAPTPELVGNTSYPKDFLLCIFGVQPAFAVWRWQAEARRAGSLTPVGRSEGGGNAEKEGRRN